jgi:virginiamycin B lyase
VPVPTPGARPTGIVRDADGDIWFTERQGNKIGRVESNAIAEVAVPTPFAAPRGIAVGPDGNVWFTENSVGKVGRVDLVAPPCGTGRGHVRALPPANLPCTTSRT